MPFFDFLGGGAGGPTPEPVPSAAAPVDYSTMVNPVPPEVQALNQPTNDPAQIQQRQAGWLEVVKRVTSDPNLMRAVGMFGASASQPMQPGQNLAGHLSQAAMVGRSAYDFGQESAFNRQLALSKEGRAQAESEANVAGTKASTAQTLVRTEGLDTANQIAQATKDETIRKAGLENQKIDAELAAARTTQEKAVIELERAKRLKAVFDTIPDATLRQQALDEAEKQGILNKKAVAEAGKARAEAGEAGAKSGYYRAETNKVQAEANTKTREEADISSLPTAQERINARTKGKGGSVSAQVQMLDAYKTNWKTANPGASEAEAATAANKWLTEAKGKDDDAAFIAWAGLYGKNDYAKDRAAYDAIHPAAPGTTPSPTGKLTASPKSLGNVSQADLEATAKKYGMTVEQVKQRLGIK